MGIVACAAYGLSYRGTLRGLYHKTDEKQIKIHSGHNNYRPGRVDFVQDVLCVKGSEHGT